MDLDVLSLLLVLERLNRREGVAADVWSVFMVLVFCGVLIRHTIYIASDDVWKFPTSQDESIELLDVFNDLRV